MLQTELNSSSRWTLNIPTLVRVPMQTNPPTPKSSSYANLTRQYPEKAFLIPPWVGMEPDALQWSFPIYKVLSKVFFSMIVWHDLPSTQVVCCWLYHLHLSNKKILMQPWGNLHVPRRQTNPQLEQASGELFNISKYRVEASFWRICFQGTYSL